MSDRFKFRARWRDTGEIIADFMDDYTLEHLNDNKLIIEQCTSLKDKNGVLAFESDFAKSSMEGGHAIYPIEWDDEEKCLLWGGYALSRLVDNGFEVVGNKFQNPELLELTND